MTNVLTVVKIMVCRVIDNSNTKKRAEKSALSFNRANL